MNTKPCMSSHNKWIIILIHTKDCLDIEGYKNQTNFVAQKMANINLRQCWFTQHCMLTQHYMLTQPSPVLVNTTLHVNTTFVSVG